MRSDGASRTAVFVCQGRAVADGRLASGRFHDPIARLLLHEDELDVVDSARAGSPPADVRSRMAVEAVRACSETVVPRTVAIDEAMCAADHDQVVVVGAGLDSRPWRLSCLRNSVVYVVDHPASLTDATERTAGLSLVAGGLVRVAVDLGQADLDQALADAGHDLSRPTTWVWEGVIPYLRRDAVSATTVAIAARSHTGSILIAQYQLRSLFTAWARRLGRLAARLSGLDDPLADEPWRSLWTPESIAHLLGLHGLTVVSDENLLTIAARMGLPTARRRSLASGRIVIAHR